MSQHYAFGLARRARRINQDSNIKHVPFKCRRVLFGQQMEATQTDFFHGARSQPRPMIRSCIEARVQIYNRLRLAVCRNRVDF